jgi:hypothetical protein
LKDFLVSAKHLPESSRDKEAPHYWSQMADPEKLKWRKRLQELKEKYINKYENFLKVRYILYLSWQIINVWFSEPDARAAQGVLSSKSQEQCSKGAGRG